MSRKRVRYFVDDCGLFTHGAVIFMALAVIFTLLGSLGQSADRYFMLTGLVLPLACELLFLVLVTLLGKRTMMPTALPAVVFAVYFIIRAFSFGNIVYMVIFMALYLAIGILYTATVFGWIRNKWLLSAIIFITFAFNIAVIDYPALSKTTFTVTFAILMQEIAVLFILLSLLFSALALKSKRPLEEVDLPKMHSHKVIVKKPEVSDTKVLEEAAENDALQPPADKAEKNPESTENTAIPMPENYSDTESASDVNTDEK